LESADRILRAAIEQCEGRSIAGVGVAAAGPVDAATGTLLDPPNLKALDGVSLKERWERMTGYPVRVGNDANLAALGEFYFGAGRDASRQGAPSKTLLYITVSTGIGGGVVDQERVFLGANGLAAEIGHMVIDRSESAPWCQCGNRGCLEALASGGGIARTARAKAAAPGAEGSTLAGMEPGAITSELVFQAAASGDPLALTLVDEVVDALAVGLTNGLHVFNPDLVVLGGGVTVGLTDLDLLPRIDQLMRRRAMSEGHRDFRLVPSKLGDRAGMAGAAALAWEAAEKG
jgi:glucokinase